MSFGLRVKEVRERLGLTQTQLAKKAEVSPSLICQIEADKKSASSTTIANLAKALHVSADYLLELEDDYEMKISKNTEPELLSKITHCIYCHNKGIEPSNK